MILTAAAPSDIRTRLQALLRVQGYNTTSYLTLEPSKQIFFTADGKGAVAYIAHNGVAVAQGEPICDPADLEQVLAEFIGWCRFQRLRALFFEVSEKTLTTLSHYGYHFLKTGEEPFIELDQFTLAGGAMANVRSSANTARRRGVSVRLHDPKNSDAEVTNQAMENISAAWLASKATGELSFTLGTLSLNTPGDRLFFVAEQEGETIAFLTFAPIYARKGMYLDLMRRSEHCPPGTMDLLLATAFQTMATMGLECVTMGMAPLANVQQCGIPQNQQLARALAYTYEHGNKLYNFQALYRFKQKFCPQRWENKYLAYQHLGWAEISALTWAIERADLRTLLLDGLKQALRSGFGLGMKRWAQLGSSAAALLVGVIGGS